jgi:hypothetical protein
VGDTKDGGASVWLRNNPDGSEMYRYLQHEGDSAMRIPTVWPPVSQGMAQPVGSIPIRCKCGGIDLLLKRGDYAGLMKEDMPSNIGPKTHKLFAGFCGCESCQLQSGVDVVNWAFAEMKDVSFRGDGGEKLPTSASGLKDLVDAKALVCNLTVQLLSLYRAWECISRVSVALLIAICLRTIHIL